MSNKLKSPKNSGTTSTGILYRDKACLKEDCSAFVTANDYLLYTGEGKLEKIRYKCGCIRWDTSHLKYDDYVVVSDLIWNRAFSVQLAPGEGHQKFTFRFSKKKP